MEGTDSDKAVEKNIQGKIADSEKRGKFFIFTLITLVKTKVIANIMSRGVITAQDMPKIEPTYLAFKSRKTIFISICR